MDVACWEVVRSSLHIHVTTKVFRALKLTNSSDSLESFYQLNCWKTWDRRGRRLASPNYQLSWPPSGGRAGKCAVLFSSGAGLLALRNFDPPLPLYGPVLRKVLQSQVQWKRHCVMQSALKKSDPVFFFSFFFLGRSKQLCLLSNLKKKCSTFSVTWRL